MKQEERDLLLVDLCARLPYDVMVDYESDIYVLNEIDPACKDIDYITVRIQDVERLRCAKNVQIEGIKSYLRPMSSMTKEERIEFSKLLVKRYCEEDWEGHTSTSYCIEIDNVYTDDENGIKYPSSFSMAAIDWLNKNQFDYRGLIETGLALVKPEGMYDVK